MTEFKTVPTTVNDASIWTGAVYMDLVNPNPSEIHLGDIARALSRICRFNGFCREFYSVAEHSVLCVKAFALHAAGNINDDPFLRDIARDILMHDAAEAYLGDVTRPLKRHLPDYKQIENRMEAAIAARFNLSGQSPEWVKRVDLELLALEKRDLMPGAGCWPVVERVVPPDLSIRCAPPEIAERAFLDMACSLNLSGADCARVRADMRNAFATGPRPVNPDCQE